MFIPGVMSIIMQKNTLCASKIRVIYFCPNCVSFFPKSFLSLILEGLLASNPPSPIPWPQLVRLCAYGPKYVIYDCILKIQKNRTKSPRFYLRFEQNAYRSLRLKQCFLGCKVWGFYPQGTHLKNNLVKYMWRSLKNLKHLQFYYCNQLQLHFRKFL